MAIYTTTKFLNTSIGANDCLVEVELDYVWEEGVKGRREAGGMQIEPDEPPRAVIIAARVKGTDILDLLPEWFWDDVEEDIAYAHEDHVEGGEE